MVKEAACSWRDRSVSYGVTKTEQGRKPRTREIREKGAMQRTTEGRLKCLAKGVQLTSRAQKGEAEVSGAMWR